MFFPHFQVVHIFSTPPSPPPPIFLMKQPSSWLTLSGRIYRVHNHKSYEGGYLASIGLQNQWGSFYKLWEANSRLLGVEGVQI
jgi:hypothetical protein